MSIFLYFITTLTVEDLLSIFPRFSHTELMSSGLHRTENVNITYLETFLPSYFSCVFFCYLAIKKDTINKICVQKNFINFKVSWLEIT